MIGSGRLTVLVLALAVLPPAGAAADGSEALGESYRALLPGGGAASEGVGLARRLGGPASATITLTGVPAGASVERAFLYWMTYGAPDNEVTFADTQVAGSAIGETTSICPGGTSYAYRADVTSLVAGNGTYAIADVGEAVDGEGASLVVVYRGAGTDLALVAIRDGAITGASGASEGELIATTFGLGLSQDPLAIRLHIGMGDGSSGAAQGPMRFRGTDVTTANPFWAADGPLWDDATIDIPASLLPAGTPDAQVSMYTIDDCLLWAYAALEVRVPVPPVTIVSPADGTVVASNAVHVTGSSRAGTALVSVREGAQQLDLVDVGDDGAWQTTIDLGAGGGQRTITAVGLDAAQQPLSPPDTVTVVADIRAPHVELRRPEPFPPSFNEMEIGGSADDDIAVVSVTVYAENILTGERKSTPAECNGCGTTNASFNGKLDLFPGLYLVWAEAIDAAGRSGVGEANAIQLFNPFHVLGLPDPFED